MFSIKLIVTTYKNQNLVLNLLINCIPARSVPRILSIKDKCTFHFSVFLIIGLCNSLSNSHENESNGHWFHINSLLMPLLEVFLSNHL